MCIDRNGMSRVSVFAVLIALGGGLVAQSAGQTTQQLPTQPTANSSTPPGDRPPLRAEEGSQIDPSGVALKPDATGSAPGASAGEPAVRFSGKVGPGGTVVGQNAFASPDGSTTIDKAIERLGPGGVGQRAANEQLGPGGTGAPSLSQAAKKETAPAKPEGQQPAKNPGASGDSGRTVNEPVAKGGFLIFIDPTTGEITQPTDAQLQELNQQNQAANVPFGAPEAVERVNEVGGGMAADVPTSLFPLVTATIGADGKVTLGERQAEAEDVQSGAAQHLGPAGDVTAELPPAADVTIDIVNLDGAGEGFNDPTAVAPVFGNPGITRGAQRLNAFRAAAEYWGAILKSSVPIRVNARMDPMVPCDGASGVLGSAGPTTVHRDFAGAPVAATWYVQATANSRAGVDLDAQSDIGATFNSDVDNPVCLGATSWWYGIGAPAPAGTIDFYTVVLHEIGHGIGFLTLVNLGTGAEFGGFDDAYERWIWDWTPNAGWPGMTNAQRQASAVNTGQVIFWGPRATESGLGFLTAGLNAGYPRLFAPNPVQGGSSISHFDTVATPNELMEPAITAPPGPYAYLTSGALEDIGWRLLANGVFDYGGIGTWTWNPTDGWFQPTGADPTNLEPFNGNFVGLYNGTWLWNGTSRAWSQLTTAVPNHLKACRNNLLWSSADYGMWRWNATTGWAQLTTANPESLDCLGSDAVWEGATGTWLYNFGTGAWSQITGANPTDVLPCGSRLVWWRGWDTWYWEAATGWHQLAGVGPETTECYRGQLVWEGAAGPGTWIYNFTAGAWVQITSANPEQILAWGPNLVWENAAYGTWVYNGAGGWAQITTANPTLIATLGADLLWAYPAGTWVWRGGGGGAGWVNITGAVPTEIVSTGQVL